MRLTITLVLVVIILVAAFVGKKFLHDMGPKPPVAQRVVNLPVVEVMIAGKTDLPVTLETEGRVAAARETMLSAEVSGRIIEVSPKFEAGGEFAADELILKIDPADYQAALANAEASVADAKLALKMETARAESAERDWAKLGRGGEPSEMVLRKPHIASATARLAAAEAMRVKALNDLKRTELTAPYACRVRNAMADLGAVASPGMQVGEVYETDKLEVRLPFSLDDYGYLTENSKAEFSATVGGEKVTWTGEIVRREGEINRETLSSFVVASVTENPDAPDGFKLPPPGLFVNARLEGRKLTGVVPLPREVLRGQDRVMAVDAENRLRFHTVTIQRSTAEKIMVSSGLEGGEKIILTRLERPVEGMEVSVVEGEAQKTGGVPPDPERGLGVSPERSAPGSAEPQLRTNESTKTSIPE